MARRPPRNDGVQADFGIQGSAVELKQRPGQRNASAAPSESSERSGFAFRPGARTVVVDKRAGVQHKAVPTASQRQENHKRHSEVQVQSADDLESPTWSVGNRNPVKSKRPSSAGPGLTRSSSAPALQRQRPSSAVSAPASVDPTSTYQRDFTDMSGRACVKPAAYKPRSVIEIRRELDRRHANRMMNPDKSSLVDFQKYLHTSESHSSFRQFSRQEIADARPVLNEWQSPQASHERKEELDEQFEEAQEARKTRNSQRKPPKVPVRYEEVQPGKGVPRPRSRARSLAELIKHQSRQKPHKNKEEDAASVTTSESSASAYTASESCAPEQGSVSSYCMDTARTDASSSAASSAHSSSSLSSARSSSSIATSRSTASSARSSHSSRRAPSARSSASSCSERPATAEVEVKPRHWSDLGYPLKMPDKGSLSSSESTVASSRSAYTNRSKSSERSCKGGSAVSVTASDRSIITVTDDDDNFSTVSSASSLQRRAQKMAKGLRKPRVPSLELTGETAQQNGTETKLKPPPPPDISGTFSVKLPAEYAACMSEPVSCVSRHIG